MKKVYIVCDKGHIGETPEIKWNENILEANKVTEMKCPTCGSKFKLLDVEKSDIMGTKQTGRKLTKIKLL